MYQTTNAAPPATKSATAVTPTATARDTLRRVRASSAPRATEERRSNLLLLGMLEPLDRERDRAGGVDAAALGQRVDERLYPARAPRLGLLGGRAVRRNLLARERGERGRGDRLPRDVACRRGRRLVREPGAASRPRVGGRAAARVPPAAPARDSQRDPRPLESGAQSPIPGRHTSESGPTSPPSHFRFTSASGSGPTCACPIATYHSVAGGADPAAIRAASSSPIAWVAERSGAGAVRAQASARARRRTRCRTR